MKRKCENCLEEIIWQEVIWLVSAAKLIVSLHNNKLTFERFVISIYSNFLCLFCPFLYNN
jgi:hypothetical protein